MIRRQARYTKSGALRTLDKSSLSLFILGLILGPSCTQLAWFVHSGHVPLVPLGVVLPPLNLAKSSFNRQERCVCCCGMVFFFFFCFGQTWYFLLSWCSSVSRDYLTKEKKKHERIFPSFKTTSQPRADLNSLKQGSLKCSKWLSVASPTIPRELDICHTVPMTPWYECLSRWVRRC